MLRARRWLTTLRVYLAGLWLMASQLRRRLWGGGFREPALPPQPGRVALVTGGGRGVGLEAARRLARLRMRVFLAGNDAAAGQEAAREIREDTGNGQVDFLPLDLSSLRSVRRFARSFLARGTPLHVLVNNAGVMLPPARPTEDGLEPHLAVNHLGPFLLTRLLLGALRAAGTPGRSARVVNVASATHRAAPGPGIGDDGDDGLAAYARSKLLVVLSTLRLQALLDAAGPEAPPSVTAVAADPGLADTKLFLRADPGTRLAQRLLGRWAFKTPGEASQVLAQAAVCPSLEGRGGLYLRDGETEAPAAVALDPGLQARAWAWSSRVCGLGPGLDP